MQRNSDYEHWFLHYILNQPLHGVKITPPPVPVIFLLFFTSSHLKIFAKSFSSLSPLFILRSSIKLRHTELALRREEASAYFVCFQLSFLYIFKISFNACEYTDTLYARYVAIRFTLHINKLL